MDKPIPVILSGGAGKRLWPASTEALPKQFLPLFRRRSLLELTLARVKGKRFQPPWIAASVRQQQFLNAALQAADLAGGRMLLEPCRRDSACAIAAVAVAAAQEDPDAVLMFLPADHLIPQKAQFQTALMKAARIARRGKIVTLGVKPTAPATEFGYLEHGAPFPSGLGDRVLRFHEKPDRETALQYLARGNFSWNAGIFVAQARVFIEQARLHMPQVLDAAAQAVEKGRRQGNRLLLGKQAFASSPTMSIDYALMEKCAEVAVVPVDFEWSDVGNWASLHRALAKGEGRNVVIGPGRIVDGRGNMVLSHSQKVRVLGLDNVAVVVSEDGVLVLPLSEAARAKDVV